MEWIPDQGREEAMPFVNIRIVKEVIANDPAGKKQAIAGPVQGEA